MSAGPGDADPAPAEHPATPAPPPCPGLGRCLTAGVAKALEELEAACRPAYRGKGGWVRGARIAARRLRMLLGVLVEPGDPDGIQPLRQRLGAVLEALSGSRDLHVVRSWLARPEPAWSPEEQDLRATLLAAGGLPDEAAGPGQDEVARAMGPVMEQVRTLLRRHLPEPLHRPGPAGFPGVRVGGAPGSDPLPAWSRLRDEDPSPAARAQARDLMEHLMDGARPRLLRVTDRDCPPEEMHALRRSLRRLRYLVEGLRPSFPGLGRLRTPLKQLVWLLGQVNDRRVVAATLGEAWLEGPGGDLRQRLRVEVGELLEQARALAVGPLAGARLDAYLSRLRAPTGA